MTTLCFQYSYSLKSIFTENLNFSLPGTPLEELEGVPAPNFTRGVSGGATRVSKTPLGWSPSMDTTAPNKITDLVTVNTSVDEESVTVAFTAPGDDLDFGNGNKYFMTPNLNFKSEVINSYANKDTVFSFLNVTLISNLTC